MADKQIGIRLDVKSTGLSQVDDTLETISKNLQGLNENVMQQQQKGWGSDAQTKNLREQLRSMEQMLQTAERLAKTKGLHSDSFSNFRNEIGSMQRDLGNMPTYKSDVGGWVHDRFGRQAASGFDKTMNYAGKAAAIYGSLDIMSTLKQGMSNGTQLAYGYGDLAKRMSPTANSQQYGIDLSNRLQGYGYNDQDLLQNSTTYAAATGRMDTSKFTKQMQAIEQLGRGYGLDLSGVTQNFASAYQSGVTGGSDAQLSPQEYANLVANAVNRGNMQGKETQVMGQLQQLVQMGVASSGQAGDVKTMAGMLSIGDKSGNQALISQLPQMLGAISNGMMSPGGGYAGQALMWNAISGGQKMGYFEEQVQAAKGAFGVNDHNGKTNIENAMTYLSTTFGGKNIDEESVMLSTLFPGMNAAQSKQFIQTYTNKDGSFKQGALNAAKAAMGQPAVQPPQNVTDTARNNNQTKDHSGNIAGQKTVAERSWVSNLTGDALNMVGAPLVDLGMIGMGAQGVMSAWNTGKKVLGKFGGSAGGNATPSEPIPSSPSSKVVNLKQYAKGKAPTLSTSSAKAGLGKGLGFLGELGSLLGARGAGFDLGDFVFGHKQGGIMPGNAFGPTQHYTDTRDPIWKRLFESDNSNATSFNAQKTTTPGVTPTSATVMPSAAAGAALAPIVASTIVALGPYMGQLKTVLGSAGNATSQFSGDLVSRGNQQTISDLVNRSQNNSVPGYQNMTYGHSANPYNSSYNIPSGGSATFGGGSSEFVSKMAPYAKQVSTKTGLPTEFILGQWGLESGWGTSPAAKQNNNFAGIEPWSGAGAGPDSQYAGYDSLGGFANGYANFLLQNRNYSGLLQAARGGASDDELAGIIGHSGYAQDPNYTNELQGAIGAAQSAIKVTGSVTVNLKQSDGTVTKVNAPLSATFGGLSVS